MSNASLKQLGPGLQAKLESCCEILSDLNRVVVAYSGGVDSTLLLALAVETLGKDNVLPAMAVSTIFPSGDITEARQHCRAMGLDLLELPTAHLTDSRFSKNPSDRCYYCKTILLKKLTLLAEQRGFQAVVTGANAADKADYRPGSRAEQEMGVRRPLLEARMDKNDIRQISRAMGLATWDRPSSPCLVTRVPYDQPLTEQRLRRIEAAETVLHDLGFEICRVRDHHPLARVEIPMDRMDELMNLREKVVEALGALGFTFVTLDLAGFRSGAMDETLSQAQRNSYSHDQHR
ncbi:MAG: ATP-dependent sacrificial sulfur transferase LarE [Phycisphaerae bacterium]